MTLSRLPYTVLFFCLFPVTRALAAGPAAEIVLHAPGAVTHGNWTLVPDATAADGVHLENVDRQDARLASALAAPVDYFDITFRAVAGTPYRLWIRSAATNDADWNDSVFIQFSDSMTATGETSYRIGTTDAALYILEDCTGCGSSGWGWNDTVYGPTPAEPIYFATTGEHTIRVQVREDGLSIDQIVLSPAAFVISAPGASKDDRVILASTDAGTRSAGFRLMSGDVTIRGASAGQNQPPVFDAGERGFRIGSLDGAASAPATLLFTASATGPEANDTLTYTWDFGDGSTPQTYVQSTEPSRQNAVHTYVSGGTFIATVTIGDQAGNSTQRTGAVTVAPGRAIEPGTTITVMQWNVYKGRSSDTRVEQSRIWLQARWMAAVNPDVIVLEEVMGSAMAEKYRAELQRLRPQGTWSYVFKSDSGTESASAQGVAILTRLRIQDSDSIAYAPCPDAAIVQRSAIAATLHVKGQAIVVVGTHLSSYSSDADRACRAEQAQQLMAWAGTLGPMRVVAGDLNADPGETAMSAHLLRSYRDTWDDTTHRTAYPDNRAASMVTRTERIDYVLTSRRATLELVAVQVPDTRDVTNDDSIPMQGQTRFGALNDAPRASDHEMVIATFLVR